MLKIIIYHLQNYKIFSLNFFINITKIYFIVMYLYNRNNIIEQLTFLNTHDQGLKFLKMVKYY